MSDDQRLGGLQVLVAFGWISGNEPEVEAIWAQKLYFLISFEFTDSYSLLQNVVLESQKRWWKGHGQEAIDAARRKGTAEN